MMEALIIFGLLVIGWIVWLFLWVRRREGVIEAVSDQTTYISLTIRTKNGKRWYVHVPDFDRNLQNGRTIEFWFDFLGRNKHRTSHEKVTSADGTVKINDTSIVYLPLSKYRVHVPDSEKIPQEPISKNRSPI